jgi:hypothetical protein
MVPASKRFLHRFYRTHITSETAIEIAEYCYHNKQATLEWTADKINVKFVNGASFDYRIVDFEFEGVNFSDYIDDPAAY